MRDSHTFAVRVKWETTSLVGISMLIVLIRYVHQYIRSLLATVFLCALSHFPSSQSCRGFLPDGWFASCVLFCHCKYYMLQPKGFAYNVVCFALHLLQIENYIVENMKSEMAQIQQNAVQNHTATMLEIGTSLLSQTAEQTRKLTDVETQVCRRPRVDKLLTGKISFFSFSLLHKHRAHFSTEIGETCTFLFIGNNNNDCLTC